MPAQHRLHLTAFGAGMLRASRQFSCFHYFRVLPVPAAGEPIRWAHYE